MSTPTTALVHLEQRTADRAFAAAGSISDAQSQIAGLRRDVKRSGVLRLRADSHYLANLA
jgi:hypothetical protein